MLIILATPLYEDPQFRAQDQLERHKSLALLYGEIDSIQKMENRFRSIGSGESMIG